ncbi:hypothetical protein H7K45_28475 [Mycobacterium yunnanensis]|uniref:Uncharacterized protein n=1 Tax=Mycobacterium yunnanensis TaxID=368477 RepID=A0A9X2Z995_9MYCO|nr:hypothetical protein [Mycobacterium yunnanensis]MCV7424486.1 hypothetical protein [Mycobacterium yunnanensis]
MTTLELAKPGQYVPGGTMSWWDSAAECAVTIAEPAAAPDLFGEYHRGAVASYAKFGVSDAIDADAERCAADTALFWVMTDVDGRVIGGVRTKGALAAPTDSHAVVEWAGQPGESAVRTMLAQRIPSGVIEMKAAWMDGGGHCTRQRAKLHARSGFHLVALLGVDYYMATSAAHTLERWRSTGGVVAPIPATPYPDARYETKMMWWDRRTFTVHGEPDQVASVVVEVARIHRRRRPMVEPGLSPRTRSALSAHRGKAAERAA